MTGNITGPEAGSVLVRIRRMDLQWATCGIGIMPPAERVNEEGIFTLCSKLVPGQVVSLPFDHDLTWHPKCEIVRGLERDEFVRPWVFESQEQAVMADPSRSQLSASQIADGLNMVDGAVRNRMVAHGANDGDGGVRMPAPFDDGNSGSSRPRNAHMRDTDGGSDTPAPVRRAGRPHRPS